MKTRYLILCATVLMTACFKQPSDGAESPVGLKPAILEQGTQSPPNEESSIFGTKKKKRNSTVGDACATSKTSCGADQFCDLKTEGSSCSKATAGTCTEKPDVCTRDFRPVCGCDGKTYGNDCARKASGVSLAHTGACEAPKPKEPGIEGAMCGGIAGLRCAEGLFCDMNDKDGLTCNTPDRAGTCATQPQICTFEYRPVCGCDGKTYGNDCARRAAGVARSSEGECTTKTPESDAPPKTPGPRIAIEGTLLTLEPKACMNNPWQKTKEKLPAVETSFTDKELTVITAFFQLKKINLVELGLLTSPVPVITCKSCNCGRGDILTVVAKKEDVETLKKDYGFAEMPAGQYLTATPIACNNNPWEKLTGKDELSKITAYLKDQSIEALYLGFLYSTTPRMTCASCACPRGDRLMVKTKDNTKTTPGFTAVP